MFPSFARCVQNTGAAAPAEAPASFQLSINYDWKKDSYITLFQCGVFISRLHPPDRLPLAKPRRFPAPESEPRVVRDPSTGHIIDKYNRRQCLKPFEVNFGEYTAIFFVSIEKDEYMQSSPGTQPERFKIFRWDTCWAAEDEDVAEAAGDDEVDMNNGWRLIEKDWLYMDLRTAMHLLSLSVLRKSERDNLVTALTEERFIAHVRFGGWGPSPGSNVIELVRLKAVVLEQCEAANREYTRPSHELLQAHDMFCRLVYPLSGYRNHNETAWGGCNPHTHPSVWGRQAIPSIASSIPAVYGWGDDAEKKKSIPEVYNWADDAEKKMYHPTCGHPFIGDIGHMYPGQAALGVFDQNELDGGVVPGLSLLVLLQVLTRPRKIDHLYIGDMEGNFGRMTSGMPLHFFLNHARELHVMCETTTAFNLKGGRYPSCLVKKETYGSGPLKFLGGESFGLLEPNTNKRTTSRIWVPISYLIIRNGTFMGRKSFYGRVRLVDIAWGRSSIRLLKTKWSIRDLNSGSLVNFGDALQSPKFWHNLVCF